MSTTQAFETGTIYTTGEGRDYTWRFEVVKRTAKFVTVRDILSGDVKRVGVTSWNGAEIAYPLGQYSMAPSISADSPYLGR